MGEIKTEVIAINVEPTVMIALEVMLSKKGGSKAAYVRKVLIDHLKDEGVLTDSMIAQMVR